MKQILYVLRHPVDGFWQMKQENSGKVSRGLVMVVLTVAAVIFNRQTRAFVFNNAYNVPLNVGREIAVVVLPVALFCLANWAVTTLLDGKGTMKDIFIVTTYSLAPLLLFLLATPLISHLFSINEAAYLIMVDAIGYVWMGLMIFIGIQQVHEYSFGKMFTTLLLTAFSAAVIIFIALMFFSLLQELGSFVYSIYREVSLRI